MVWTLVGWLIAAFIVSQIRIMRVCREIRRGTFTTIRPDGTHAVITDTARGIHPAMRRYVRVHGNPRYMGPAVEDPNWDWDAVNWKRDGF